MKHLKNILVVMLAIIMIVSTVPFALAAPHTHTVVIDQAVAPTCISAGFTQGKHCATCGEVIVAQKVVDILPHAYREKRTVAATCTTEGYTVYVCINCNEEKFDDFVAKTVHIPGEPEKVNEVKPTCGKGGSYDLITKCSVCGVNLKIENITVDMTGYHIDSNEDGYCDSCGWDIGEHPYTCPCRCHDMGILGKIHRLIYMFITMFLGEDKTCCKDMVAFGNEPKTDENAGGGIFGGLLGK